jgi:hypothetical protein
VLFVRKDCLVAAAVPAEMHGQHVAASGSQKDCTGARVLPTRFKRYHEDTFAGFSNFKMRNGQQSNLQVAHNTSIQDFTKSLSRKNAEDLEPNCGKGDAVCSPRFR